MKKVLLTNISLINFTGSELDTLTIADYFLDNGYDVTIFTLDYGYPLLANINKNIKLIDYSDRDLLEKKYDLLWAHHYPLVDYLLFEKEIEFSYIHYVSLSSYMGIETPPIYYKHLNLVSTISYEGKEMLKSDRFDVSKINVFHNYSYENYFTNAVPISENNELSKICIVSNHIPKELLDFCDIAKNNGLNVDIYGRGYTYKKVDDDLLKEYDLIISIGKTINYGLSLGIPCYCYDHFGGDQYITLDNFKNSLKYNFSGRFSSKKLTGEKIYNDIVNNYCNVLVQIKKLKDMAYETFCIENMMKKTLKKIYSTKKFDVKKVLFEYPVMSRIASLYVNELGSILDILKKYNNTLKKCQLYFDYGEGYIEDNSIKKNYYKSGNLYTIEVSTDKDFNSIRFDFCEENFMYLKKVYINDIKYNYEGYSNCIKYKEGILSINDDPSIVITGINNKKLKIAVEMERINEEKYILELNRKLDKVFYTRILNKLKSIRNKIFH